MPMFLFSRYLMRPLLFTVLVLVLLPIFAPLNQKALAVSSPDGALIRAAKAFHARRPAILPQGCMDDGNVDYPDAINCILNPHIHDCVPLPDNSPLPCSYLSANRPSDFTIKQIVIHDIEGSALNAISTFQARRANVSSHYVVDSDGTVYQITREKDIAFHAGNMWYNQHAIGIEHTGFDETGFLWYNAAQYLASAKLVAYLLNKYNLPLDHDHIVSHGTIPSPTLQNMPNHVDPGPYWLWDYYEDLIRQQGVMTKRTVHRQDQTITIHPHSGLFPLGRNGAETPENFNFFYLYSAPSTAAPLIPGNSEEITDERANVESGITYFYTEKRLDPAGSGKMLYRIWFGVESPFSWPRHFAHAQQVWLAVASQDVVENEGTGRAVTLSSNDGGRIPICGKPVTNARYTIGDAPDGSIFISAYKVLEQGNGHLWYEINYNHRQAWVAAANVDLNDG
ncbi:MAG TPA: peptidoglycan recognition family protein [Ktedonosporobacter sp.]|nr:peptidoglycan recognition family protein [Ktedonosporobacter sp.]